MEVTQARTYPIGKCRTDPINGIVNESHSIVHENSLFYNLKYSCLAFKIKEFEVIDKRANEIMQRAYDKNDIYNFSINEINKKISKSTVEFLDDLFVKPENENWIEYLQVILLKNERYVYFGFILIKFLTTFHINRIWNREFLLSINLTL